MRAVLAEGCMHGLQRPQRERAQPHCPPKEGKQAPGPLLSLDCARAVDATQAAIHLVPQLRAGPPHSDLIRSVEQREEVGPNQGAQHCMVVVLVVRCSGWGRGGH